MGCVDTDRRRTRRTHRPLSLAALLFAVLLGSDRTTPKLFAGDLQPLQIDAAVTELDDRDTAAAARHASDRGPLDDLGRPMLWRPPARVTDLSRSPTAILSPRPAVRSVAGENGSDDTSSRPELAPPLDGAADAASTIRPTSVEDALRRPGTISFRKTPLQEVVFLLSDLWEINIVAGESVTGDVSGTFHDTELREVLSAILSASGYGYRQRGNSLIILPIAEIGGDDPEFVSKTLPLPPGEDAESIVEAARTLISERGQMVRIGQQMVLIKDHPNRISRVQQLFADLGGGPATASPNTNGNTSLPPAVGADGPSPGSHAGPNSQTPATDPLTRRIDDALYQDDERITVSDGIAYFTLKYTEAEQMQEPLQAALGVDCVVAVFVEENRILVRGDDAQLRLAAEAIRQLDVPRSQVRITALIYDVSLREVERLGIDWNTSTHSAGTALSSLSDEAETVFRNSLSTTSSLITDPAATGATNLAFRSINENIDVGGLIQALDESAESKLLADPSISVGDRRQASIRIVQRIPIIAADPVDNSGVVFSQVQFEDAGVILNVTPRIGPDNTIEMLVQPEYSVLVDFINNNPIIDSRTASTTVRVANGQIFVLGGLRQKSVTETIRGVPGLKDLKYFGRLFRSHDTEIRESELIVFLKPELITPYGLGTPREQRAACVANGQLDAIAHATCQPQTPCCRDPHCPNHHPRPRVNGGSWELGMLGDYGMQPIIVDRKVPAATLEPPAFEPVHVEVELP